MTTKLVLQRFEKYLIIYQSVNGILSVFNIVTDEEGIHPDCWEEMVTDEEGNTVHVPYPAPVKQ